MNISNLQKQSNNGAGKIPKKCKKSFFYSGNMINFESLREEKKLCLSLSHQSIFGILTPGNTQHVWFCLSIYILYWIWRRDFPIHIQTGGGANNSFLWRSKTRRHKEPFCLPNFGELAKANLSPQKFFIPPPSYLIAHSYISQVFPLACSFLGFHRLSKFLLWDIIIIFCHHLGFKNLSKAKKYPEFFLFLLAVHLQFHTSIISRFDQCSIVAKWDWGSLKWLHKRKLRPQLSHQLISQPQLFSSLIFAHYSRAQWVNSQSDS